MHAADDRTMAHRSMRHDAGASVTDAQQGRQPRASAAARPCLRTIAMAISSDCS